MTRVQGLGSVLYYNSGPIFNSDDGYTYMSDLQGLHTSCGRYGKVSVQERLAGVFTPLFLPQWEAMLDSHPDKEYVDFILQGIKNGFRIGYDRSKCKLSSARKNMRSADENAQVVTDYLAAEKREGYCWVHFPGKMYQECTSTTLESYPSQDSQESGDSLWTSLTRMERV